MSHFHPAAGGGISSLDRAVENLYSLQLLFTLLSDVSRFAYKSFRLQVDSPTSRSFRLHDQVVSPTRFESIRLHLSRFAYTYKSKYFVQR